MHNAWTQYGFEYGAAKVSRFFSKKGCVVVGVETPKHTGHDGLQIYITRTGKVRIHDSRGEWSPPNDKVRSTDLVASLAETREALALVTMLPRISHPNGELVANIEGILARSKSALYAAKYNTRAQGLRPQKDKHEMD